jgi:hypothetical protein
LSKVFTLKSTLSPAQISVAEVVISGFKTLMVIYSLQVTPLVVTSTQYSVVSEGVTVIDDDDDDIWYNLNITTVA